jgi:glycosyltransferase involved in cell wall biosynthesis
MTTAVPDPSRPGDATRQPPAAAKERPGAAGHVLALVENVPFGIDTRLTKQVEALLGHGYRVTLVTRADPSNDAWRTVDGVHLLEFPAPPERPGVLGYALEYGIAFLWAAMLSARALRDRVDVVQVCQPPDVYVPPLWVFRGLGCGVVIDQRDLMSELYRARYNHPRPLVVRALKALERLSQASAHQVLCVNQFLRERSRAAGLADDRIAVVRNGPVLGRVDRAAPDPALKYGRRYLCCWAGKMGMQDRLDLLLGALHHLIHDLGRTDAQVVILGDGECLEETSRLAAELGLDPWVTFTGWVSEDTVFRHLATSTLGLDASLQPEVSPVKAAEYMAFGVPFVAFDLPETRVAALAAATYAAPGDVEGLARAIDGLLDDPDRRSAMGRAGRQRVEQLLAWDRQASIYLEAIESLLTRRRRRRCFFPHEGSLLVLRR